MEIAPPWAGWWPKVFKGRTMLHVVWGWFGVGLIRGDLASFHNRAAAGSTEWIEE
jgi:hypothetical protein